jgi:rare lipoprotein A
MEKRVLAGGACGLLLAILLSGCGGHQTPQASSGQGGGSNATTGYYRVGAPYQINGQTYYPAVDYAYDETGLASWYGPDFDGKLTANGEVYNMNDVTAAHKTLPLPSIVHVTNLDNRRDLVLRVNDRGPFVDGRIIDLSRRSAQFLGVIGPGTAHVRVQIMPEESRQAALLAMKGQIPSAETLMADMAAGRGTTGTGQTPTVTAATTAAASASVPAGGVQPSNFVVATDAASTAPALPPGQVTTEALPPPSGYAAAPAPAAGTGSSGIHFIAPAEAASFPPIAPLGTTGPRPTPTPAPANTSAAPTAPAPVATAAVPYRSPQPPVRTAALAPKPPVAHPAPLRASYYPPHAQRPSAARASVNGLFVQIGAFSQFTNANRIRARLSPIAPAHIAQLTVNGQPSFRVFIGPAPNNAAAGRLLASVRHAGYSDAHLVAE